MRIRAFVIAAMALSSLAAASIVAQDAQNLEQRIAALKKSMAQSQAQLRKYEWVETTIISHKGEVKSQKEQRCYYGADGTLQKLPIGDPQPPEEAGGRRGRLRERIVEKKKDEIQEYMETRRSPGQAVRAAEPERYRCREEQRKRRAAARRRRSRAGGDHQLHQVWRHDGD